MVISANTKTVKKVLMVPSVAPEYGRISQTGRRKTEVSFRRLPVMRRRACAGALTSPRLDNSAAVASKHQLDSDLWNPAESL
jgi:hypothetical protein